ncbi:hypothetical protein R6Q57_006232 [Mikania cordata]
MSNISASGDGGGSLSSGNNCGVIEQDQLKLQPQVNSPELVTESTKKKRALPGTPDPNAQVIALSPTSLMAKNKYICEICNKGFQRDQNLQLHRRGHNLPWKLRQRTSTEVIKRVYICPEPTCVHHNPARALSDLTGIKKHFSRKHGEKKWKCDKCSKKYAVQCDWKAHSKICGTKEYKCDCGTIFSRRDSFITHRAFCDALAEENNKLTQTIQQDHHNFRDHHLTQGNILKTSITSPEFSHGCMQGGQGSLFGDSPRNTSPSSLQLSGPSLSSPMTSATALLQKAAQMGATSSNSNNNSHNISYNNNMNNIVTTMAPPSYNSGGAYQSSETLVDTYPPHQSQLAAIIGQRFSSQFQESSLSPFFNQSINGTEGNDGCGSYWPMNPSKDIIMENNNIGNNANSGNKNNLWTFKRDGNGDHMTVDFMGVGGMGVMNFNEQHHHGMEI